MRILVRGGKGILSEVCSRVLFNMAHLPWQNFSVQMKLWSKTLVTKRETML